MRCGGDVYVWLALFAAMAGGACLAMVAALRNLDRRVTDLEELT